ncbi:MAG: NAD(P)/FAD-dependent oxidoreductase [Clostridia bacterium]|nr:NAD(P)/FAD-dependent oxidoreductase [Clostridia bacterium]
MKNQIHNDGRIIVLGAGPAGMMAAATAAMYGAPVTVIEKNKRQGRKLMITGKGRCNITNNCDVNKLIENTATNPRFLYSAFSQFSPRDTMDFFESRGVPLKTERGDRVFPQSDKAADINDALVGYCREAGVRFITECAAERIIAEDGAVKAVIADGREMKCSACIVALGGASYPATGSTGDGYAMVRQLGHTVTPISPSLVPLEVYEADECREMQGLALKNIAITVTDEKKSKVYTDFGELLFTHFGISGPVVLSASSHIRSGEGHTLSIDLKPALTAEQLDNRIRSDFSKNLNKDFANSLGALLPRSMINVIVRRSGIPPETKVNTITREQRASLVALIKGYELRIKSFRPIAEAIITSGGIKVSEIEPKTMKSKLVGGLYFAGEIIDVDAHTGGFNLQIALSTGYCAGLSAATALMEAMYG